MINLYLSPLSLLTWYHCAISTRTASLKESNMSDATRTAREIVEAFNRRDFDRMRELLHPEYSYTGGGGQRQSGPEAGIAVAQMYASAMSDAKMDVQRIHEAGDVVVVEFTGSGTHDGDFMGIAPTGRKVTVPVCNVM